MKNLFLFLLLTLSMVSNSQLSIGYTDITERLFPAVGDKAGFVMYGPAKLDSNVKRPMIILLSGIGERGNGSLTGLRVLANHANYKACELFGAQYGFIVIEPQTSSNWQYGEVEESYQRMIDSFSGYVNWKKVYLTGQSLGGGGTNRYLGINPSAHLLFAAASPHAAGPNQYFLTLDKYMAQLVNTKVPYWAFHNRGDAVVTPAQSTLAVRTQLLQRGGTAKMWFSLFDFSGHTFPAFQRGSGSTLSDGLAYVVNPAYIVKPKCNMYEWFLMNEIGKPPVAPPTVTIVNPVPAPGTTPTPTPTPTTPTPVPTPTITTVYISNINWSLEGKFFVISWRDGSTPLKIVSTTTKPVLNVYDRLVKTTADPAGHIVVTVEYKDGTTRTIDKKP